MSEIAIAPVTSNDGASSEGSSWIDQALAGGDAEFVKQAEESKAPPKEVKPSKVAEIKEVAKELELTPEQLSEVLRKYKHKIKVDGQESEIDYDQLVSNYQIREMSQRKAQEATELSKRIKAFPEMFKRDGINALTELGITNEDARAIIEKSLYDQMLREQMSPEERKQIEREESLTKREKELQEYEETQKTQKFQAEKNYHTEQISGELLTTAKEMGLSTNAREIMAMAVNEIVNARNAGIDLPVKRAMAEAFQSFKQSLDSGLSNLEGEALLQALGGTADKVRKAFLARAQKKGLVVNEAPITTTESKPKAKMTEKEARVAREKELEQRAEMAFKQMGIT